MEYEVTIGLETHIMQKTATKMFCSCRYEYGAEPNTLVCPVCLGYPGALPVMNEKAIELCCKAGLLLGCRINPVSRWDRKNYFYPDMAKNYQITQADEPLCVDGKIEVEVNGEWKTFYIERIHQEENAAKNTHVGGASLVDFNRAGTALMEIVSRPCMHSADDAIAYMTAIKQIMQYAGISNCDQEKGEMRSDVNVSVRPVGQKELGAKVEIKNMNSFAFIRQAIEYEIERQIAVLESGGTVLQETRGFDPERGETFSQRTKEDAHDYRYFPEPDLLPVRISAEQIEKWRAELPELPASRIRRYTEQLGLSAYDAKVLTARREVSDWFDEVTRLTDNVKAAANFVMGEMFRLLEETGISIGESKVTPQKLAEIIALVDEKVISTSTGKQLFEIVFREGGDPRKIVEERGMAQVSDDSALDKWVEEAVAANPKSVEEYRNGKQGAINYLVGQVMRASRGKANPAAVMQKLRERLDG